MVIIGAQIDDDILPALHAAGQRHGGVSEAISHYILEGLVREGLYQEPDSPPDSEDEPLTSFLEEAMSRVRQRVNPGETFSLNADHPGATRLFTKEEWKQYSFKPTAYGRAFKSRVTTELADIETKSTQNKQIYRRRS